MSHLIDTTEMYLRTVYELLEEGVAPLRARIAERLQHSGPTVSQTVSRMERDGLLTVHADRRILLSPEGERLAQQVMRRHRLAERLLVDVIGLEWPLVHDEACKWEHVMSTDVEHRLVDLLHHPRLSPYGTPIPELDDDVATSLARFRHGAIPLTDVLGERAPKSPEVTVRLARIGEHLQRDADVLELLEAAGVKPDEEITASLDAHALTLHSRTGECTLDSDLAAQLFVAQG